MGKQWVRQEIKRNELADFLNTILAWVLENREKTLGIGSGILAVALLGGLYVRGTINARNTAWEKLAMAQSYAYQGHGTEALQQVQTIANEYGPTAASGFGLIFAGDLLYRQGRYKEAGEMYQKVLTDPYPKDVLPFALSNLGMSQEAAGDCKSAAASDQLFLDTYQDHFLAPQVHASLARCLEAIGQKDQAKAAYERIVLLYPETHWARWAQSRSKS